MKKEIKSFHPNILKVDGQICSWANTPDRKPEQIETKKEIKQCDPLEIIEDNHYKYFDELVVSYGDYYDTLKVIDNKLFAFPNGVKVAMARKKECWVCPVNITINHGDDLPLTDESMWAEIHYSSIEQQEDYIKSLKQAMPSEVQAKIIYSDFKRNCDEKFPKIDKEKRVVGKDPTVFVSGQEIKITPSFSFSDKGIGESFLLRSDRPKTESFVVDSIKNRSIDIGTDQIHTDGSLKINNHSNGEYETGYVPDKEELKVFVDPVFVDSNLGKITVSNCSDESGFNGEYDISAMSRSDEPSPCRDQKFETGYVPDKEELKVFNFEHITESSPNTQARYISIGSFIREDCENFIDSFLVTTLRKKAEKELQINLSIDEFKVAYNPLGNLVDVRIKCRKVNNHLINAKELNDQINESMKNNMNDLHHKILEVGEIGFIDGFNHTGNLDFTEHSHPQPGTHIHQQVGDKNGSTDKAE